MIKQYDFFRTKYGEELLIDLIRLEDLEPYIKATPLQRLSYYDITIVEEGEGTFAIDNHEHSLKRGSVLFSSPGQIRQWRVNRIPKGYVLIFEEEFLCTFFNDSRFIQNLSFFNSNDSAPVLQLAFIDYDQIIGLLQQIKNEIDSFKRNDKHLLRALLYQVLILLHRRFASLNKLSVCQPVNRYIHSFIQLVDDYHHQHRTVDYYARRLHITGGHLNSIVKDNFGITAKRFIVSRNILEAKRILQYTDMSIDEIADRLNYENTTYFIRAFKEHTGRTPLQFRKRINP